MTNGRYEPSIYDIPKNLRLKCVRCSAYLFEPSHGHPQLCAACFHEMNKDD